MSMQIQIILIFGTFLSFVLLVRKIRKSKLNIDYASLWIIGSAIFIVLAIFPNIIYFLANLIGMKSSINMVFILAIFLQFVIIFYLILKISIIEEKLKNLIQYYSIDRKVEWYRFILNLFFKDIIYLKPLTNKDKT